MGQAQELRSLSGDRDEFSGEMKPAGAKQSRTASAKRKILIAAAVIFVFALALGLGLGLGLGLRGNGNDDDSNAPEASLSPLPSPTTKLPWTPKVNDTWQIILSNPPVVSGSSVLSPNVSIYDIDLFDTSTATIKALQDRGTKVICYFSAGSYEDWRPDAKDFLSSDLGKELDGWAGEKWLNLSSSNVRSIMEKRIKLAKEKGCDGVDPDNVDGYENENGLSLTKNDSISYMTYLASMTRPLNLTIGLKNAGDIVSAVLPIMDFSVNEQCVQYSECTTFKPFIDAGKPVFHIEYPDGAGEGDVTTTGLDAKVVNKYCGTQGSSKGRDGFSTVLKKMELDGWVEYCDGKVQVTTVNTTVASHERSR